jgi:hypothetical protein
MHHAYCRWLISPLNASLTEYRRVVGSCNANGGTRITRIQRIENPLLENQFQAKQKVLTRLRGSEEAQVKVAYHGTREENIPSILQENLSAKYVGTSTDPGWYGAGCYLSLHSGAATSYSNCRSIFRFDVLPGRVYTAAHHPKDLGVPLRRGYDSHQSPDGREWIIFHSDQLMPRYIISFFHAQ